MAEDVVEMPAGHLAALTLAPLGRDLAEGSGPRLGPLILVWCSFHWTVPCHTDGWAYYGYYSCVHCDHYSHSHSAAKAVTLEMRSLARSRSRAGEFEGDGGWRKLCPLGVSNSSPVSGHAGGLVWGQRQPPPWRRRSGR